MEYEVYDKIGRLERTHWWFVARRLILRTLINRLLPPSGDARRPTLCDIGCGAGDLLRAMSDRFDVTGVDSSPVSRDICARNGITVHDGMLPDGLPFADASFDVVIVADVIEHVDDDAASVRTLARLTRPGGIIVATVPAHMWMWSKHDDANHHKRRYTRATLRRVFEPDTPLGLRREVLSYFNTVWFPPIAAARLIGRLRPGAVGSDIHPVPEPANSILRWGFGLERHLLPWISLPTGVSLLAIYRRL